MLLDNCFGRGVSSLHMKTRRLSAGRRHVDDIKNEIRQMWRDKAQEKKKQDKQYHILPDVTIVNFL